MSTGLCCTISARSPSTLASRPMRTASSSVSGAAHAAADRHSAIAPASQTLIDFSLGRELTLESFRLWRNNSAPPHEEAPMITGAQAVVDCLRREKIDHVFGIPGTMNLPILDVLRATPEIRFILTRHEQGAAFMAYGFARAVNRPAIVTATEGPGVTNLTTGIGAAYKGYVPGISISD